MTKEELLRKITSGETLVLKKGLNISFVCTEVTIEVEKITGRNINGFVFGTYSPGAKISAQFDVIDESTQSIITSGSFDALPITQILRFVEGLEEE